MKLNMNVKMYVRKLIQTPCQFSKKTYDLLGEYVSGIIHFLSQICINSLTFSSKVIIQDIHIRSALNIMCTYTPLLTMLEQNIEYHLSNFISKRKTKELIMMPSKCKHIFISFFEQKSIPVKLRTTVPIIITTIAQTLLAEMLKIITSFATEHDIKRIQPKDVKQSLVQYYFLWSLVDYTHNLFVEDLNNE